MHTQFAVFTVRYSLFSRKGASSWRMGQGGEADYLARLFHHERLQFRRHTFKNITLPSISSAIARCPQVQSEVHVLASTLLPAEHKESLEQMAAGHPFLRVFFKDPDWASVSAEAESFCEELPTGAPVAHIRIDDDDALTRDYLQQLSPYITPEMNGRLVSLCSGYRAVALPDGRISGPFPYKWRFGSVGMALIRSGGETDGPRSVFSVGSHLHSDDRAPTILDGRKPAILRLFHEDNDSSVRDLIAPDELRPDARPFFAISQDLWTGSEELPAHRRSYIHAKARLLGRGLRKLADKRR